MELELKITEVKLIRDREKNPLEPQALKALKLYLQQIKHDRYKIIYLVDCFRATTAKRQREKSESSNSETDPKRQNRRASRTTSHGTVAKTDREHSISRQREREMKTSLGVDSQDLPLPHDKVVLRRKRRLNLDLTMMTHRSLDQPLRRQ